MERKRKEKFIDYLFYNNEVLEFMFGDFYVELFYELPKQICFSNKNVKKDVREINLQKAINITKKFLMKNKVYYEKLKQIYESKSLEEIIKDVLAGYVMFLTPHINKYSGADVYADPRSICYTKLSILDMELI